MKRRLFIFGNGASMAEGAPNWKSLILKMVELTEDNISEIAESRYINDLNLNLIKGRLRDNQTLLVNFLDDFFPHYNNDKITPNFNDIFPFLQILFDNKEGLSTYNCKKFTNEEIGSLIDNLIWLLSVTLDYCLLKSEKIHKDFINSLFLFLGREEFLQSNYINLNYDILLDNALTRLHRKKENETVDIDYHINFANFEKKRSIEDEWTKPREQNSISLLKPHGSLNWLHCPLCNRIELTPLIKGATESATKGYRCLWDKINQKIPIVPPTLEQLHKVTSMQNLLYVSESLIRNSDVIYFIGYGLNDYDIHFRKLLKKYIPQTKSKEIYLVCRSPYSEGINEDKVETTIRYKRLFGEEIIDTGMSFQSFVDKIRVFSYCIDYDVYENEEFENLIIKEMNEILPEIAYNSIISELLDINDKVILNILKKDFQPITIKEIKEEIKKNAQFEVDYGLLRLRRLINFDLVVQNDLTKKWYDDETSYFIKESRREIVNLL